MINRVILVGRMTKDPVLRKTGSGASVASFTIACDRRFKQEGQPSADFINCVCWNKVADNTVQFTHKGSLVGVEGRIQTRCYDDQSGKCVFVTEVLANAVQFLDPKGTNNNTTTTDNTTYQPQQVPSYGNGADDFDSYANHVDINADDLPF